ncbi:MAG: MmgE/PrpD family protein [Planctomycetota bacterium]|jgi:2-methylcitrate dehydratase
MTTTANDTLVFLPADSNQARGIAEFAIDFMNGTGEPSPSVLERTERFHTDAVLCGLSALAMGTNAPTILRQEAHDYACVSKGATTFASNTTVKPEKAILANAAAVREWDSNGTNFGFHASSTNRQADEFGHNDFYAVPIAAAQVMGLDGAAALRGMILLDEIRGRLAEVFSLKTYKIDHVVHGAIGSAATYGAMCGATAEQIESAIGMVVAHYIPWRAIRAGKQLSDSKGSSAAISTEVAVMAMKRAMRGFIGPKDIFRNPEAIFRFFEPTTTDDDRWTELAPSPFDLHLSHSGDDFAVMGMHFKLGLYEHQSAGALHGLITLLVENPEILGDTVEAIGITAYEPAYGIIGDPAKRDPKTRQSADHSMVYIVATMLRKAGQFAGDGAMPTDLDEAWKTLMLAPHDYGREAIVDAETRRLMDLISFQHGGKAYDDRYPDGIPTSLVITTAGGKSYDSGLVMYPAGHARNTEADLQGILDSKWAMLGAIALAEAGPVVERYRAVNTLTADALRSIDDYAILEGPAVD